MQMDQFRREMAAVQDAHRVDVRWWLAEGLHGDRTLREEVASAHELGFGGMEFLAMDERDVDDALYGWGSAQWARSTGTVVAETTRRGMNVSLTSGANWSNANLPTITPDEDAASQELDLVSELLAAGQERTGTLPRIDLAALGSAAMLPGETGEVRRQRLVAVLAVRELEPAPDPEGLDPFSRHIGLPTAAVLDAGSVLDLTDRVDGPRDLAAPSADGPSLTWRAPAEGSWRLFVLWQHGTGQTAEPSVGQNVTVNYLEREGVDAVTDYWEREVLTPQLRSEIARSPKAQMYMDSLELNVNGAGGMFWGRTLEREFRARRGYDVRPYLPFLVCAMPFMACSIAYRYQPDAAHAEEIAKVRHDYLRTLTDLYAENMLRPFAAWLHGLGMGLRSQVSYGAPFELSLPAAEVDGVETESLEFGSQIDAYRLLGGPAHLLGKEYSSETGATSRNHVLPHRFYDQIMSTQFAAGVTRTVLHGWASRWGGEESTSWPGHEGMYPMFSERFDSRQPGSVLYPLWNAAMARTQAFLAAGVHRSDVAILRRDHLVDNTAGTHFVTADGRRLLDEDVYAHGLMRDRQNLWWQDLGLQDAGWTYEFFDAELLLRQDVRIEGGVIQPEGPGHRAVILYQEELDADAARVLRDAAREGLRVVIVHGAREVEHLMRGRFRTHERAASRTPGRDGRDEELRAIIAEMLTLPTVAEVQDPAETRNALERLGVRPRAPFAAPDRQVLTRVGEDGDLLTVFAYHAMYAEPSDAQVEIAMEGEGAVHRLDPFTGRLAPVPEARCEDGRTVVPLRLRPGQSALLVRDRADRPSSGAADAERGAAVPLRPVAEVPEWDLVVDSWDAGATEVREEDRGLGVPSREVRPGISHTLLEAGRTALRPWSQIPELGPEVSGVGTYTASIVLPEVPGDRRVILDLGSTAGGLAGVSVNDGPEIGVDTSAGMADITEHVRPGENALRVRVASSLVNRLLARGYYETIPDLLGAMSGAPGATVRAEVQPAGLLGPVRVLVGGC